MMTEEQNLGATQRIALVSNMMSNLRRRMECDAKDVKKFGVGRTYSALERFE